MGLFSIKASGVQRIDTVVVSVTGMASTPGRKVSLKKAAITVFPPEFMLVEKPPQGVTIPILVPFAAYAKFKSKERVSAVKIRHGKDVYVAKIKLVKKP